MVDIELLDKLVERGLIEKYSFEETDFKSWNSQKIILYFKEGSKVSFAAHAASSYNDASDGILEVDEE